jgi:hypothetical protein
MLLMKIDMRTVSERRIEVYVRYRILSIVDGTIDRSIHIVKFANGQCRIGVTRGIIARLLGQSRNMDSVFDEKDGCDDLLLKLKFSLPSNEPH